MRKKIPKKIKNQTTVIIQTFQPKSNYKANRQINLYCKKKMISKPYQINKLAK